MLPSAYSDDEVTHFLRRQVPALLARLLPGQVPAWGLMSPQHMVEHLTGALRLSTGQLGEVAAPVASARLDQMRASLLADQPFSRNIRNPTVAAVPGPLRKPSLPAAVACLHHELDGFFDYFTHNPTATPVHMMFGALNFNQWQRFHFKHFAHHLEQFGLLERPLLPRPVHVAEPPAINP